MKNNYEVLEGKTVEVMGASDNESTTGVVYCVDLDVGITIHEAGTKDEVFCLNGPSSPHWEGFCNNFPGHKLNYTKMFDYIVQQITNKEVMDADYIYELAGREANPFGNIACAFKG